MAGKKSVFVSCPPMLGEKKQVTMLAARVGLSVEFGDLVQTLSEEQLIAILPNFDAWVAGDDPGTATVLEAGRKGRLRTIVKWGVGIDNIDRTAIERLDLQFAHTPGMFSHEVADMAMGYLIVLTRHIARVDCAVRAGEWIKPQGTSLYGKSAGIVGLGNIGQQLARRLSTAGVSVIGYDPLFPEISGIEVRSWPEAVGELDFLFLCCALTPDNVGMVNASVLQEMKRGLRLINVSRGALVVESDLQDSLREGHIGGAALDVFEVEPLPTDSPLIAMDNCILGTHNASNTLEAVRATNDRAMKLVADLLNTERNA